jgi:hypothetical protein
MKTAMLPSASHLKNLAMFYVSIAASAAAVVVIFAFFLSQPFMAPLLVVMGFLAGKYQKELTEMTLSFWRHVCVGYGGME